jgi:formyltetrahydrofolate-dependent phosphoribosylglycinamide formyltransferase
VAVSGRGSNLAALGKALARSGEASIDVVISDRDAPALALAAREGWPSHRLTDHTDGTEWIRLLQEQRVDLLVLAGYLKLVPPAVIAAMPNRIINIHPALLPRHGGPGMYGHRVHAAAIAAGDIESGATVHLVDEQYDRGAVLGQARVRVLPGDTPDALAERILEVEHRLLPAAVLAAARAGRPVPFTLHGTE